jgi:hypothetical protein
MARSTKRRRTAGKFAADNSLLRSGTMKIHDQQVFKHERGVELRQCLRQMVYTNVRPEAEAQFKKQRHGWLFPTATIARFIFRIWPKDKSSRNCSEPKS